jgi:hypothetical protein
MNTQKLPTKPVGNTTATLTDGKVTYSFLLDPETIQWSYTADYAANSVLLTSAQDITWKSSTQALSIPKVLFISQGMTEDVSSAIKQLTDWCLQGATLKFSYGATVVNRCHITRFNPIEKQWRSGKVTQAESVLDFMISREPVKVEIKPEVTPNQPKFPTAKPSDVRPEMKTSEVTSTPQKNIKYTDRELLKIKTTVMADLKNPAKRKTLGVTINNPTVFVTQGTRDAVVTIKDSKGTDLYTGFYFVYKSRVSGKSN